MQSLNLWKHLSLTNVPLHNLHQSSTHLSELTFCRLLYKASSSLKHLTDVDSEIERVKKSIFLYQSVCVLVYTLGHNTWRWKWSLVVMVMETRSGSSDFSVARGRSSRHSSEGLTDNSLYCIFLCVPLINICKLWDKQTDWQKRDIYCDVITHFL